MKKDNNLKNNIFFVLNETPSLDQVITEPTKEDISISTSFYKDENEYISNMFSINNEYIIKNDKIVYVDLKSKLINTNSIIDTSNDVPNFEYSDENLTNKFISMVNEDIFEFGYISNSERFINDLISNSQFDAKQWLESVFMSNFDNTKIIIGILHVISHFKYKIISPQGQVMALSALIHKNIEVRECAIRAFENWGHVDSLRVLKSIKCDEKWLFDYVQQIISDLESELS